MAEKKKLDLSFLRPNYEIIDLPSRGFYYRGIPELESGKVHIRPMTSVEEKLTDKFNQNTFYSTVDEIISKCVKEDINIDDLTPGDRIFILLRIRALSYGSTYEVKFKCPDCEAEMPLTIDLAKFEPKYVDEEVDEPVTIVLPESKATVKMFVPRSGDIRESTDRSYAEQKKSGVFISPAVYQKALCCDEFIFPDSSEDAGYVVKNDDFKLMLAIMSRLHVNDMREIEDFMTDHDHGMINPIFMNCPVCNASFEQYVALNWDFFRPRNKRNKDSDVQQLFDDVPDRESRRTDRGRTTRPGKVRELRMVGDTNSDIHTEEKIPEENS